MDCLLRLLRNEEAATAVEYAVMLALILLSVIAAISSVGLENGGMWSRNVDELKSVQFIKE
ncbi:MAG: Flp family type IVb pilin [Pirellulales bacterium]|nr:Flp family type IVb pilin [Pirellulales bacterium]